MDNVRKAINAFNSAEESDVYVPTDVYLNNIWKEITRYAIEKRGLEATLAGIELFLEEVKEQDNE